MWVDLIENSEKIATKYENICKLCCIYDAENAKIVDEISLKFAVGEVQGDVNLTYLVERFPTFFCEIWLRYSRERVF